MTKHFVKNHKVGYGLDHMPLTAVVEVKEVKGLTDQVYGPWIQSGKQQAL